MELTALISYRMYREPTEASKCNSVKDPSAVARSAIRRQASVRGHPSTRVNRSNMHSAPYRSPLPRSIVEDIAREVGGLSRPVRSPMSSSNPGGESFDMPGALSDPARRETGQRTLNDIVNHRHPGRRLRVPRETSLTNLRDHSFPGEGPGNQQNPESLPFTPRFAPAFAFHSTAPGRLHADAVRLSPFPWLDGPGEESGPHVPLLRRVGQRSVNEAHRPNREPVVDGLGDRQRSPSPDDDHENDAWETLLTTITPDANLPSADSSFNSASASATNAPNAPRNGNSADSSNPRALQPSLDSMPPAMHMVLDPYPEYLNPCDYPASSDSETEPEQESNHHPPRRSHRARFHGHPRHSHLPSTMNSHHPIPALSLAFSELSSYQHTHNHLQHIIDRIARGENIPDFVWTTVGLTPPDGRGADANDRPHDTESADGPVRQRI
jgi:hypothetical protein